MRGKEAIGPVLLGLATGTSLGKATTCKQTKVAIIGAGMSGITAAQALHNNSVTDFLIIETNSVIGGRVVHTSFGSNVDPDTGKPYVVELGANWIQGTQSPGGPSNPIWTLAQQYGVKNYYNDYNSILTYTQDGEKDYSYLLDVFDDDYAALEQDAGYILTGNLLDRTYRTGLSLADWKPKKNMEAQAVEWWEVDWELAYPPEFCSHEWGIINYNTTFYQFSEDNNYVFDPRGYNYLIESVASTFLNESDPRLLLNTTIKNITYSSDSVTMYTNDSECIEATYAISTVSLGVLQNDVINFSPELPEWKQEAIEGMAMGTYTKIFYQFDPSDVFWDKSVQFFLYASPTTRGYYPVWQSLDNENFLPGSGIIFATVVDEQSYRLEALSEDEVKAEGLKVLGEMFPNVTIPEPTGFLYPKWSETQWSYGSYSNWPPSYTLEQHQNLRANLGNLYFSGEACSAEYYGFLQGAYFEGQYVGNLIGACAKSGKTTCTEENSYSELSGTTPVSELTEANGWMVSSFLTYGDD